MQRCDFKFLKLTQKSLDPSNSTYPALFFVQNVGVPVLQLKLVGVRKHRWMGTCCGVASVMDIKNDVQLQASFQHYEKKSPTWISLKTCGIPSANYLCFFKTLGSSNISSDPPNDLGTWLPLWDLRPLEDDVYRITSALNPRPTLQKTLLETGRFLVDPSLPHHHSPNL